MQQTIMTEFSFRVTPVVLLSGWTHRPTGTPWWLQCPTDLPTAVVQFQLSTLTYPPTSTGYTTRFQVINYVSILII